MPTISMSLPPVDAIDRAIIVATQGGLPLVARPYHRIAESLQLAPELVMARMLRMQQVGVIRRLGVVPNHYAIGYRANGMSVWDVPDALVDQLGQSVGGFEFVSHCYRRPRRLPQWPYNLFAMVHGKSLDEVEEKVAQIAALLGEQVRSHAILYSTRILKKPACAWRAGKLPDRGKIMFRITQYMREIAQPTAPAPKRNPPGPVVIWNLIRRCNLTCKHCYSISADKDFSGELSTSELYRVMDDLRGFGVPVLILSGGEPLLRDDIYDISRRAKEMGFYVGLSTNGTLVDASNIERIAAIGFDYVGISLDGIRETHDVFRRKEGAFDASLHGVRLCRDAGIKIGVRFTLTQDNAHDLPALLQLVDDEGIDKFYLSHLNYAGRGNKNRGHDAFLETTRNAMDLLFDTCWKNIQNGVEKEFVTGNNDADGVYLLHWVRRHFPQREAALRAKLAQWGGNSSGVNVANIDNLGNVHPDTFWWHHNLGNVRERAFSGIWRDTSDPLMAGLKAVPRTIKGRCGECSYFDVCGGNTRVRALQLTGDAWQEDPACYMSDDEIGLVGARERVQMAPFIPVRRARVAV